MNIHHLELFYYVAKHGGISQAVRNIPYGIQQPAVSGQILQLEEFLGAVLFQRRPFSLTESGARLFRFIEPFFSQLQSVSCELRGEENQQLRIAASAVILRDHLPDLLFKLRGDHPGLRLTLREGHQPAAENWLLKDEIDIAVTALEDKPSPGIRSTVLIELPLVLLVTTQSKIRSAQQLWEHDRIAETLIALPPAESISRHFQRALNAKGLAWPVGIELSSLNLIETYVRNGFGIGLSVAVPRIARLPGLRSLPLEGFSPITVVAIYRARPAELTRLFLGALEQKAGSLKAS